MGTSAKMTTSKRYAWLDADYINFTPLLSYGAPYNFLDTTRGRGKTWSVFWRAYKHFMRHHKGTILVRRTEDATKKTKEGAFNGKFCRFHKIDPATVRVKGDFAEVCIKDRWYRFLYFCTLSNASDERSNDDDFYDLMILDEGKVCARKRAHYQGDEVMDLMDLYDSKRRESRMQLLILGNRESVGSPYMNFFGIPPLPIDFNGVKKFRGGTVICAQSTRPKREIHDFDTKVKRALEGTRYGDFAYHGKAKDFDDVHVSPKPRQARYYCGFDFGTPVTAWLYEGRVYFTGGVDSARRIVCDKPKQYKDTFIYTHREKPRFVTFMRAKRDNAIYYSDQSVAEAVADLFVRMGI